MERIPLETDRLRLLAPEEGVRPAEEKRSGERLGWFAFRPLATGPDLVELDFRLPPRAFEEGLVREGAAALVGHGFEVLAVETVVAFAPPGDRARIRVLEELGMWREKTGRRSGDGDVVRYRLDRGDWGYAS